MTTIVTVASGKGGVGKSVSVSNMGLALAACGRRVVLADLDVGGSNLATLFGVFESGPDLGGFLSHKVNSLDEIARPLWRNLSLIVGAGETLATANPNWGMKQRLLRHLSTLDADVVIVDVGAGAGLHALDFFNAGDIRVVVTIPEPTASVDAYRFIKLATIRDSITNVSTRNPDRRTLERRDFASAQDVWQSADAIGASSHSRGGELAPATPWVIVNQADNACRSFERLQLVARRFLGHDLKLLGQIPRSQRILDSIKSFLPVVEADADCPASRAFHAAARNLDDELARLQAAKRFLETRSNERAELHSSL